MYNGKEIFPRNLDNPFEKKEIILSFEYIKKTISPAINMDICGGLYCILSRYASARIIASKPANAYFVTCDFFIFSKKLSALNMEKPRPIKKRE